MRMERKLKTCATLFAALFFSAGCGQIRDAYKVDRIFYLSDETKPHMQAGDENFLGMRELEKPIDISKYYFPGEPTPAGEDKPAEEAKPAGEDKPAEEAKPAGETEPSGKPQSAYQQALASGPKGQKARNRLQEELMAVSDRVCEQHKGDIVANATQTNIFFKGLAAGLSGAAATFVSPLATYLSAGATASLGANALVNEQIYQKLFVGAIIRGIDKGRELKNNEIKIKQRKETAEYSVSAALRDAQDYHHRCSFYAGLVVVNQSVEQAGPSGFEIQIAIDFLEKQITQITKLLKIAKADLVNLGTPTAQNKAAIAKKKEEIAGHEKTLAALKKQYDDKIVELEQAKKK